MNSFGRIFKVEIFGESHGPSVGILIDGCPPGISLNSEDFLIDLGRRNPAITGTTPRKEKDIPVIKSGVFNNYTTGTPILIEFPNNDVISKDYSGIRNTPRPGHSDFVAHHKFKGYNDYRGGGHFSGRLTSGLTAAGIIAKKILGKVQINAKIISAGGNNNIEFAINNAITNNDSIGGIVECRVNGLEIGLGEPFFDSLESLISHIVFSIPAIKGIEFGSGFKSAEMFGSEHNDEIINSSGETKSNNAGGINGGLSNGNELVFRVAVKPTSSISKKQQTVNLLTNESEIIEIKGRHDVCIALRVPPVLESVVAIVLADLLLIRKGQKI